MGETGEPTQFDGAIEISLPGEEVEEDLLDEPTPEEAAEFEQEMAAIDEATRPAPGDAEIRLGATALSEPRSAASIISERLDEDERRIAASEAHRQSLIHQHRGLIPGRWSSTPRFSTRRRRSILDL
jgi:hypothetical protein